jgi:fatty-acid peroxygenase
MRGIPKDKRLDSSIAFKRDPYGFISSRSRELGADVFITRLMLRKTVCMTGAEAARLFYEPGRFMRHGAAPEPLQKTLLGTSGVQMLDDEAHRHRKSMFLSLMTPERVQAIGTLFSHELRKATKHWAARPVIALYDELQPLLTRVVCSWAGVPLADTELHKRTRQLAAMFDYAGRAGPKHLRSRAARKQAEAWTGQLIADVRSGAIAARQDSALHRIATHRDLNGQLLDPQVAAVELINILRPTVAVSVYIVFAAHAMHQFPETRAALEGGDAAYASAFVQEVRRFYPFFPAVPARVRRPFSWNGFDFPANTRVMLDLHGTNHDERVWQAPQYFKPQRFLHREGDAYTFVPQGGGDHLVNHRCPGEWITVELMRRAIAFLLHDIRYTVPWQDLEIDQRRLPALPKSRFIMSGIQPTR